MNRTLLMLGSTCLAVLLLSSCSFFGLSDDGTDAVANSSSSEASVTVTGNVSYTGIIEDAGVTIYQEGTHKLVMDDGRFILLQSTDVNLDLDTYIGKMAVVRGSVQPTIEAGGTLMRVEVVTLLSPPSPSAVSAVMSTSSSTVSSSVSLAASSSSTPAVSSAMSVASSASVVVSSSSSATVDNDQEAKILLMVKQQYGDISLWTQSYCSSHIGFCIKVHKNWYFKSFGATTSNLWHVEFGMEEIEAVHMGSILLNLVTGLSSAAGATSGEIRTQGNDVVGFFDWNDNTHFEIVADVRLRAAVEFLLRSITPHTLAE